jgi:phospholipase/carboxylesterase
MNLTHVVYEPAGNGPHPTIVALHGWGSNAMDLVGLAPHICDGQLLVLCPQGPIETPIGPGINGFGWFPLANGGKRDVPAILSSRKHLSEFLKASLDRYPIDPNRLIVLGFSQGGAMAYSLALGEPGRFAALVSISSWLSTELLEQLPSTDGARSLPTLVQHGTQDPRIEVDRARKSVEILRDLKVPVSYREYDMGHEINQRSLTDLSNWLEEKVLSS